MGTTLSTPQMLDSSVFLGMYAGRRFASIEGHICASCLGPSTSAVAADQGAAPLARLHSDQNTYIQANDGYAGVFG
eukprot:scaffold7934_cov860-Prasinococcus_capsulatus_cf.AAC.2